MTTGSEINEILEELKNIHYSSGFLHQRIERYAAITNKHNEIQSIYNLVESHAPSLRFKTILRYEKLENDPETNSLTLNKNYVKFPCKTDNLTEDAKLMLERLKELPEEWSVVQLTSRFSPDVNINTDKQKFYTTGIHLCVFNCGGAYVDPFTVLANKPKTQDGTVIELLQEIHDIIADHKNILSNTRTRASFRNRKDKMEYIEKRRRLDDRLKRFVTDVEDLWLGEFKCLLVGKYVNKRIEKRIEKKVEEILENEASNLTITERTMNILPYVIRAYSYLKLQELKRILQYLFPNLNDKKDSLKSIVQHIKNFNEEMRLSTAKRQPVILIVDDSLDLIPWEMISILKNEPVSRIASLHFLYGLFKEHEKSIKNGYKIIKNPQKGAYVINPDQDLKNMEKRITSFIKYWLPEWNGVTGKKPTPEKFIELLTKSSIFCYNGHGSGAHLFPLETLQKHRIPAVVLLFGCGSTKLNLIGPQTEWYGSHQTYFITCTPCIVGMLWEVTDVETDVLTTEFMSTWIPSKAPKHWMSLDLTQWKKGEQQCDFAAAQPPHSQCNTERDLLRALTESRKTSNLNFFINRAGCIARGIPVKIID